MVARGGREPERGGREPERDRVFSICDNRDSIESRRTKTRSMSIASLWMSLEWLVAEFVAAATVGLADNMSYTRSAVSAASFNVLVVETATVVWISVGKRLCQIVRTSESGIAVPARLCSRRRNWDGLSSCICSCWRSCLVFSSCDVLSRLINPSFNRSYEFASTGCIIMSLTSLL